MEDEDAHLSMMNSVRQLLSGIHTCMPGTVLSYDGKNAVVQPSLSKIIADGRILPAPSIYSVPVVWPTSMGGQCRVTMPLQKGDGVTLHFSMRALEDWHDDGNAVPSDPRQYDLTDAIAVPGLNPDSVNVIVDTTNLNIQFNEAYFKITPSGEGLMHFPGGLKVTGSPTQFSSSPIKTDQTITASAEITANGIPLSTHVHEGVESGDGTTGQPI